MKDVIIYHEETRIRYCWDYNLRSYEWTDPSLEALLNAGASFEDALHTLESNKPTATEEEK